MDTFRDQNQSGKESSGKEEELFSSVPEEPPKSVPTADSHENVSEAAEKSKRPWLNAEEPQFEFDSLELRPVMSVETCGASDDVLTVIEKLPRDEQLLKALVWRFHKDCRLKAQYRVEKRFGVVEIIGDKRIALREYFASQNIPVVG